LIALVGTFLLVRSQRHSNKETNTLGQRNLAAVERSSIASEKSSAVADRAAGQASRAADQLDRFRLHEDTIKTLYWAADHAITPDSGRALLGLEVLAALVQQADDDADQRGHRLVRVTNDAVKAVAIPTFLSILTNAVRTEEGDGGGALTVTAVDLNATKLLLAHGHDLSADLRNELETIAQAGIGQTIKISELHAARHLDTRLELARERQIAHEREIHRGMGLSR
jgi:hypothetical protein